MSVDLHYIFARIEPVARSAGALALKHFRARDRLEIHSKRSLTDLVSNADREVEALIRAELSSAFPKDALLGEELGLTEGQSGRTWVIDPIDGTAPYLNGLPGWCVSIGLMEENKPLLGAIYAPMLDEMFLGARGVGATLNGDRIFVTDSFDLTTGLLGLGSNDLVPADRLGRLHADLAEAGIAWVRYGSGALMLAYVAAGRLVGYCEPRMSVWDCLAAYALIDAAGGRHRDIPKDEALLRAFPVMGATNADYDRLAGLAQLDDEGWSVPAS